ncbi:hypothetical protein F7725_003676 [Dissostichus mawsoni]|uniref:Uncharacterized protein n=1 Tax=Dissostichus mawsoni TaxID=36200 RepID=A0A7J5YE86_DISMA|nr:hypothetical protein F7725_003676 [Dissostichus mawsoni]
MYDSERCHQKQAVCAIVIADIHVKLIQGNVFSFLCVSGLDKLRSHMSFHNVALPQISYPKHEAQFPIMHGNDCVVAEQYHDGTNHKSIYDAAHDGLKDHHEDSSRAFLCHTASSIPNGRLGLNGKQERSHEGFNHRDTRNKAVVFIKMVHVTV